MKLKCKTKQANSSHKHKHAQHFFGEQSELRDLQIREPFVSFRKQTKTHSKKIQFISEIVSAATSSRQEPSNQ